MAATYRGGKSLRLRGKGLPPPGGGPAGDLHIKLSIPEHPLLRRRGNDLELDVPITIGEAMRGASIQVPTPTGEVAVKVPAGSSSGTKLRLRGRGVQAKKAPGDLYLVPREDRVAGPGASYIMAAFTHAPTDGRGGRFFHCGAASSSGGVSSKACGAGVGLPPRARGLLLREQRLLQPPQSLS